MILHLFAIFVTFSTDCHNVTCLDMFITLSQASVKKIDAILFVVTIHKNGATHGNNILFLMR